MDLKLIVNKWFVFDGSLLTVAISPGSRRLRCHEWWHLWRCWAIQGDCPHRKRRKIMSVFFLWNQYGSWISYVGSTWIFHGLWMKLVDFTMKPWWVESSKVLMCFDFMSPKGETWRGMWPMHGGCDENISLKVVTFDSKKLGFRKIGDSTEKVGVGNYPGWEMTRSSSGITSWLWLYPIWNPQMRLRFINLASNPGSKSTCCENFGVFGCFFEASPIGDDWQPSAAQEELCQFSGNGPGF